MKKYIRINPRRNFESIICEVHVSSVKINSHIMNMIKTPSNPPSLIVKDFIVFCVYNISM